MMPEDELNRRLLELGTAAMQAVVDIQSAGPDWHVAVQRLSALGHRADVLLAEWYDAMTTEEIDAEFSEGEPVSVETPPEGVRVSYYCSFTRPELAAVKRWDDERYTGDVVHDAALAYIHEAEGVRIALAKLKGSEPTRAEILSGLVFVNEPTQAPSGLS